MAKDNKKSLKVTEGQKSAGDSQKTAKASVGEESASKSGKPSSSLFSGLKSSVKSLWGKAKDSKKASVKKPEVTDKKASKKAEKKEGAEEPLTVSKKTEKKDAVKESTVTDREVIEESATVLKQPVKTKEEVVEASAATSKEPAEKKESVTVSKEKKPEPVVASKETAPEQPAEKKKPVEESALASKKAGEKAEETAKATASTKSEVKQEEPVAEKPVALKEVKAKPKEPLRPQIKLSGLFAFKMEMTSFYEKGKVLPVTALHYEPWRVSQVKTKEKEGYSAVQLACHPQKNQRCTKPLTGHLKPAGFQQGARYIRELRLEKAPDDIQVGHELSIESLKKGDIVKIFGLSKGRGFAGVMKRWGFRGGKASHGSKSHRRPGSIGQHTEPSRVFAGRKMPGHYGHEKVCLKNVKIVDVLPEENLIFVKGAVPGSRNTLVTLTKQESLNA